MNVNVPRVKVGKIGVNCKLSEDVQARHVIKSLPVISFLKDAQCESVIEVRKSTPSGSDFCHILHLW